MMKKSMTGAGMAVLIMAPLFAATSPELERLEQAVKYDQSVLANAGRSASKPQYAAMERQKAQETLASDQAALEAFKAMGPSNWRLAQLEKAVRDDQADLTRQFPGEKWAYTKDRQEAARRNLARDQAALESFKTMGPTNWEIAQHEQGIRNGESALRSANSAGKLVYIKQQQDQARRDIAYHQAAIDALKGQ